MAQGTVSEKAAWQRLISAIFLPAFTSGLVLMIVYAGISSMIAEFRDPVAVGWLVSAHLLVAAAAAAIGGRLGDLYGHRTALISALAIALLGCLITALSPSIYGAVGGRALQGATGAFAPLCFGLIRANAPAARVSTGIGFVATAASLGAGAGLLLAGMLSDAANWRASFLLGAGVSALAIGAVAVLAPSSRPASTPQRIDIIGGVLFVGAVTGVLLALSLGSGRGWNDPLGWTMLAGALAAGFAWWRYELSRDDPLIDPALIVAPGVRIALLCAVIMGLAPIQATQMVFLLLQQPVWTGIGLGISATLAGLIKVPSSVVGAISGVSAGVATRRLGAARMIVIGFAINAVGWLILLLHNRSVVLVGAVLALCFTVGSSILAVSIGSALMEATPKAKASEAAGVMIVFRSIGQAIGAQAIMVILATDQVASASDAALKFPSAAAYSAALWCLLVLCLVGVGFGLASGRRVSGPPGSLALGGGRIHHSAGG